MSQIDEIKSALDIVQVVSETVDLDTRSRTPKANCPFHAERTPSFVVFPETGTWRCFGACATGGDVISFIQKRDELDFRGALQAAAQRAGIELDNRPREKQESISPLIAANEIALGYFWTQLRGASGEDARAYLEGRGIDNDTARRRDLGLAPNGMDTLAGYLKSTGTPGSAAAGAGLVVQTSDGGWRDMFKGRLTIAIRDAEGRVVGFGGRSLDGSDPKYLNTASTEIFDKSRLLYGLHWAAKAIRSSRQAIVVEGYMDVITAQEAGFENVVASMGTAITAEQVGLLTGMTDTVVLALDSDTAGQEATLNSLETVWGAFATRGEPGAGRRTGSVEIKIARLDSGKDPDEVIRNSPNEWQEAIDGAAPLLEWLIAAYARRFDANSPEGKKQITEALFPLIAAVGNPYEQDRYLTTLAETLSVSIEQLRASAGQLRSTRRRTARRPAGLQAPPGTSATADRVPEYTSTTAIEEHLLGLVFAHEDLREYASDLDDAVFEDATNRNLFTTWKASTSLDELRNAIPPDLGQRLDRISDKPLPPADQPTRVADISECVRRLLERHLRLLKSQEERILKEIGAGDEPNDAKGLVENSALETNERLRQLFARQR